MTRPTPSPSAFERAGGHTAGFTPVRLIECETLFLLAGSDDSEVALLNIWSADRFGQTRDMARERGDYIVRAVNSHAAMREALQQIAEAHVPAPASRATGPSPRMCVGRRKRAPSPSAPSPPPARRSGRSEEMRFEFNVPDVAHVIVVGPTQCGKSLLLARIREVLREFGAVVAPNDTEVVATQTAPQWERRLVRDTTWVLREMTIKEAMAETRPANEPDQNINLNRVR
jgi:hypothetical protein